MANSRDEKITYEFSAKETGIDEVGKSLDDVSKKSEQAGNFFEFFKEHLAEIVSVAAAAEAAIKAIEFGKESLTNAEAVEASLSRVRALAQGAADTFGEMDAAVEAAAKAVNISTKESASGLAALVSNGLDAKSAVEALIPTLQLARIAGVDVNVAAAQVAQTLKAFGLSGSDAQRVVDQLTSASHGAAGGLAAMSSAAAQLAPDAKTLGLGFTDVVSILGLLNSKGLDTEKSIRGLRSIFQELQDPTSQLRGELLALGDGTNDFGKAVAALTSGTPRANQALLTLSGPARTLIELLGQAGPDAIAQFNAGLEQTQGTASKTAAAIDDNLRGAATRFGNAIDQLGEKLVAPILTPFKEELERLAGKLNEFADSPDFEEIRAAVADMAQKAARALDEFITGINWDGLAKDGKKAVQGLADDFGKLSANARATAEAINKTFAALGVAYHGVRGTIDGVVGAVSSADAAIVDSLKPAAEELDKAAHTGGVAAHAFDVMSDSAHSLADNALEQLDEQTTALRGSLSDLGVSSDDAAQATEKHGEAASAAAPKIEAHAAASEKAAGASEELGQQLGLVPEYLDKTGQAAEAAVPFLARVSDEALKLGGGPLQNARQALVDATHALSDLIREGNATPEAMQAAERAVRSASTQVENLEHSATGAGDAVKTALEKLHIASQQQLTQTANDFQRYFETVRAGSDQSAAGIANTQNAFLAYARARLAAVAQLDDGTKTSVQADLQAQAAVLGISGALADLEKQSANSSAALTTDAKRNQKAFDDEYEHLRKLREGYSDAGNAGSDMGNKVAAGAKGADEALKGTGRSAKDLQDEIDDIGTGGFPDLLQAEANARAGFLAISDAAAKAFDAKLVSSFALAFDSTGAGFGRFAAALNQAAAETATQIANDRSQLQGMIDNINAIGTASSKNFGDFGNDAATATARIEQMIAAVKNGNYQVGVLGQQDLGPLQQALEAARQRTLALADQFKSTAQQIADELDQLTLTEAQQEEKRHEQVLKNLKEEAEAAGKYNSDEYQQAVDNENRLHAIKEANAQKQDQQQQQQSNGGKPTTNGAGASANNGGNANATGSEATIPTATTNLNHSITVNVPNAAGLKGMSQSDLEQLVAQMSPQITAAVLQQLRFSAGRT